MQSFVLTYSSQSGDENENVKRTEYGWENSYLGQMGLRVKLYGLVSSVIAGHVTLATINAHLRVN